MKALQRLATIHDTIKQKVEKVLIAEYMSNLLYKIPTKILKAVVIVKMRCLNQRRYING